MVSMRQLEAFCAVIDHQTVTGAARFMRLSQPAVSKLVAGLEVETKLNLFRRERRRLVPTEEGLILHQQAQAIFARLRDIGRLSEELRNLECGRLNVVTMTALGRTFLPDAMSSFLRDRPGPPPACRCAARARSSTRSSTSRPTSASPCCRPTIRR